ncbi:O-antigen ligase family protein [Flavobacterium sp. J27]|uniref:O-antigen ligase family protein n=1 Tax=Flavobacterium sp. J27 TaxID=2060419 RepID=UPI001031E240|nr:O-antigen ligase family protein [Flavobacterium sp. J27]
MGNIYSYLKNLFQEISRESKNNVSFFFLTLFIISIPLPLGINNACLILFLLSLLFDYKALQFTFSKRTLFPILLFVLASVSYFWSVDKQLTIKDLPRNSYLLLIPLAFLFCGTWIKEVKVKLLKYYSYSIVAYVFFYLIRAIIKYIYLKDIRVFYYHGEYDDDFGLVPKSLNAIHMSVFVSLAYFYFLIKEYKTRINKAIIVFLMCFIFLLSSKNIILVFIFLNLVYYFFYTKLANKMRIRNLLVFIVIIGTFLFYGNIKQRFSEEFKTNKKESIAPSVLERKPENVVNYVSIKEAWSNQMFTPNDFFSGTAFRVYQLRLFFDFQKENAIFWTGFGQNASGPKLEAKGIEYNVFLGNNDNEGYQNKNFHNQYIQTFAELGFLGFLILLTMLLLSIKKGFEKKDFIHIVFTFLMISLFLTESFLTRQRGIVFFSIFYCLFNLESKKILIKK